MFFYERKINYYETDKMGITHHSNYIRFMEEARVAYLDSLGFGYNRCENLGLVSPVISVSAEYLRPTTFDDEIEIIVFLKEYNGIKIELEYAMKKNDRPVFSGTSKHCFVSENGTPISIKKELPEFHEILMHELADTTNQELRK